MLPTGREQDVLPVTSRLTGDYLDFKGGPNPGPRHVLSLHFLC
jgi:hypothetical protein